MGEKIFILEDNHDISFVLDLFLSGEGFEVKTFDLVSLFDRSFPLQIPDLYLLDVMLPDGNGWAVCNKIKSDFHTRSIPVLMMSAHTNDQDTRFRCAANGFISKPFDLDVLLQNIRQQLTAH